MRGPRRRYGEEHGRTTTTTSTLPRGGQDVALRRRRRRQRRNDDDEEGTRHRATNTTAPGADAAGDDAVRRDAEGQQDTTTSPAHTIRLRQDHEVTPTTLPGRRAPTSSATRMHSATQTSGAATPSPAYFRGRGTWNARALMTPDADMHFRRWRRLEALASRSDVVCIQETHSEARVYDAAARMSTTHTAFHSATARTDAGGVLILLHNNIADVAATGTRWWNPDASSYRT